MGSSYENLPVDALFGLFAWVLVSLFATVGLTTTRK